MKYKSDKYSESMAVLKTLITLSIPTILEQLLSTLLQYVDTAMVGQLGEQATASISVTTNINWLVNSVPSALATAALAMIARSIGAGNGEMVSRINAVLVKAVIGIGVVLGGICIIMAPFIPGLMGAEQGIHKAASVYFAIISVPLIFRAASSVFGAAIRATQNTKT
ncbi:MAG: MATE family efflux transporter, partial [Lachnospiraceae bacterium]